MAYAETFVQYFCSLLITIIIITPNLIAVCVNYSGDRSSYNGLVEKDEYDRIRAQSRDLTIEEYSSAEYLLGPFVRIYTTERGRGPALPKGYYGPHARIERKSTNRVRFVTKEEGARARDIQAPEEDVQFMYYWGGITHISVFGSVAPGVEWLHFLILTALMLPAVFLGSRPKIALVAVLGMAGSVLYAGLLLTLPAYAIALLLASKLMYIVYPNGLLQILQRVTSDDPAHDNPLVNQDYDGDLGFAASSHHTELGTGSCKTNIYPKLGEPSAPVASTLGYKK